MTLPWGVETVMPARARVCVLVRTHVHTHLLTYVLIVSPLQDLRYFKSEKTSRGILQEGWRDTQDPIMCSYKLVTVKFEVWGLQTRVEQFVHKVRGHGRSVCMRTYLEFALKYLNEKHLSINGIKVVLGALAVTVLSFAVLKVIRDVLLLGHRQAFAWVDEWIGTSVDLFFSALCDSRPLMLRFGVRFRGEIT